MIYSEKNRKTADEAPEAAQEFVPDLFNEPAAVPSPQPSAQPSAGSALLNSDFAPSDAAPRRPMPRRKVRLIKPWGYVGLLILFSLPLIGLIFLIVFSCSDKDRNRKNFARGYLLYLLVCVLVAAAGCAAGYFLLLKPLAAPYGGDLNAIITVVDQAVSGSKLALSEQQLAALKSGELSGLLPEEKQQLEDLLASANVELLQQYLPQQEPVEGKSTFVTELPAALPDTFSGKSISAFTSADGEAYYAIFDVSDTEYGEFLAALAESFTEQANDANGARYYDAAAGQTLVLSYSADDALLSLVIF